MSATPAYIDLLYLCASVLFILGLKGLSHPRTAVRGNFTGALGMLVAVAAVLLDMLSRGEINPWYIAGGAVVGSVAGLILAIRVPMTGMPQMVALLNGFGGLASVLVAGGALVVEKEPDVAFGVATGASALIGAVTFTGSLVAFGKLQELLSSGAILMPFRTLVLALTAVVSLGLCVVQAQHPGDGVSYILLSIVALALGIFLTIPIGGADMPVVIALLNSYSGLAGAATGFVLGNNVLIVSGSLVGASGIILTQIMCKAMNRSLFNVMFGVMGGGSQVSADDVYGGKIKSTTADEIAVLLDSARRVVVVPGYGLAVAQAQHSVAELAKELERRGVEVEYAIHPVAGRMPGHMNVLLAEADVPYDKLIEMDEINPTFPTVDVAIVIGANDTVNPIARTDPKSPIAGMPILDVDKARTVIVVKRSLSPGFAGIPNPLFACDNTLMYFADGKKAVMDVIGALKEL